MRKGTVRGIIIKDDKVAVIKRVREREGKTRTYYVFPGGGVEEDETFEQAMKREAKEELGVEIRIDGMLYEFVNLGELNHFMLCEITEGIFGSGTGPEFTNKEYSDRGQLISREDMKDIDLVPNEIRDKILNDSCDDKFVQNLSKIVQNKEFPKDRDVDEDDGER